MEQLVVKVVLKNGEVHIFNFSYVRNFSFSEKYRVAKVVVRQDGEYRVKTFTEVTECVLRRAYE